MFTRGLGRPENGLPSGPGKSVPPAILPLESLSARSSSPLVFMLVVDWKNNVPDSVAVVYTIPYRRSSTPRYDGHGYAA